MGLECAPGTPQSGWRAARLLRMKLTRDPSAGQSHGNKYICHQPNVHANRSCSQFKCKLLDRRWRKREERKLEVAALGCTRGADHNCGRLVLIASCLSQSTCRAGFAVALQGSRGTWQESHLPEDLQVGEGRLRPLH